MIHGREGFSLLLVVWLAALLGAVGLQWSVGTRLQFAVLTNHIQRIETSAAAEAGLSVMRARLDQRLLLAEGSDGFEIDPWRTDRAVTFTGQVSPESDLLWQATVDDLGRRINLNVVDVVRLRRFLNALVIDSREAARIADATLDWRDADDLSRAQGAEREAYRSIGAAHLPTNRPFSHVREWAYVLGVTDEIYHRVAPHLSVVGSGRVNIATAPDAVLLSLPGFGPEALGVVRQDPTIGSLNSLSAALSPTGRAALRPHWAWLEARATFVTEELQLEVMGHRPTGGYRARLHAVLVRNDRTSSLVHLREMQ